MKRKYYLGIFSGITLWGIYSILVMLRTKSIISEFGSEINAINQSAQQIFNYFILFESGMGQAYLFKMFEPMADKNYNKIASLYAGLSISMGKIAVKMSLAILPVAGIYAAIMNRQNVEYFSACFIIILLGIRFVIPYFFSVSRKTLLILYDYKYYVDIVDSIGNIVTVLIELFLMWKTDISIVFILCIGCIVNALLGAVYEISIRRLCRNSVNIQAVPGFEAEQLTKDIILHQVSGLLNSNIDTLLLSIVNIQLVTIYQAYNLICTYPVQLINKISELFRARFGIRLANNDEYIYRDFQRLLSFHMLMAVIAVATFITDINPFIGLWIGEEFVIQMTGVYLFAVYMIQRMTINVIYIIRDGKGLYKESKMFSIKEAVMNLILSILLVKRFEIAGVMMATVIAVYLGLVPGNTKIVFKQIFNKKNYIYIDYLVMILTIGVSVIFYRLFMKGYIINSWGRLIVSAGVQVIVAGIFGGIILCIYKLKYLRNEGVNKLT